VGWWRDIFGILGITRLDSAKVKKFMSIESIFIYATPTASCGLKFQRVKVLLNKVSNPK